MPNGMRLQEVPPMGRAILGCVVVGRPERFRLVICPISQTNQGVEIEKVGSIPGRDRGVVALRKG